MKEKDIDFLDQALDNCLIISFEYAVGQLKIPNPNLLTKRPAFEREAHEERICITNGDVVIPIWDVHLDAT